MSGRGSLARIALGAAAVAVVAPLLGASRPAPQTSTALGEEALDLDARIEALLGGAEEPGAPRAERVAELAALGPAADVALVRALARGVGAERAWTPDERAETLLEALGERPRAALIARALSEAAEPAAERRRAGLILLGAFGSEGHLRPLFDGARAAHAEQTLASALGALEWALAAQLAREPSAHDWVARHWTALPPEALPALVRAVRAAGRPAGLDVLLDVLERGALQPATVLAELAGLAHLAGPDRRQDLARSVRFHLDARDPFPCQTAALVLGRLGDSDSVGALIDLLDEEHRGVRTNAYWALKQITSLALRCDVQRWRVWHRDELAWFEKELDGRLAALSSSSMAEYAEALRHIAARRLHREVLADEVAVALEDEDPQRRWLAVQCLAALGAPALPALRRFLADPDERVAAAARAALGEPAADDSQAAERARAHGG